MAQLWGGSGNAIVPMSFGKSFDRMNGQPLDPSSVIVADTFDDAYAAATAYAKTTNAYVGMRLSVSDGQTTKFYGVTNTAGDLQELGGSSLSECEYNEAVHVHFVQTTTESVVNAVWGNPTDKTDACTCAAISEYVTQNIPVIATFYDWSTKDDGYIQLLMDASEYDEYIDFYGWYHGRMMRIRVGILEDGSYTSENNIPITYIDVMNPEQVCLTFTLNADQTVSMTCNVPGIDSMVDLVTTYIEEGHRVSGVYYNTQDRSYGQVPLMLDADEPDVCVRFYGWCSGKLMKIELFSSTDLQHIPVTYLDASLPQVTKENEGQILRVVGGQWSVTSLPNAEEASF